MYGHLGVGIEEVKLVKPDSLIATTLCWQLEDFDTHWGSRKPKHTSVYFCKMKVLYIHFFEVDLNVAGCSLFISFVLGLARVY